jgi:hypothetical protein
VQYYTYIRTLAHYPKVENALHGRFHTVEDFARGHIAKGHLVGAQGGYPRTGATDKGLFADSPAQIAARANRKPKLTYAMRLGYK